MTTILLSIIGTFIALTGVFVAYRVLKHHKKIARAPYANAIRDACKLLMRTAFTRANLDNADVQQFNASTRDLRVHFPAKVNDYLDMLYRKGNRLHYLGSILENLQVGAERTRAVDEQFEILEWFCSQDAEIDRLLKRYL